MADHHDLKTRNAADDIADDDPLAELARIIGYERPQPPRAEIQAPQTVPDADVFDLEAELLRELEVSPLEDAAPEPAVAAPAWEPEAAHAVDDLEPAPDESDYAADPSPDLEAALPPADAGFAADMTAVDDTGLEGENPFNVMEALDEELAEDLTLADEVRTGAEAAAGVDDVPSAQIETDVFDALVDWPEDEWQASVEDGASEAAPAPMAPIGIAPGPAAYEAEHDDILADISRFDLPGHGRAAEPAAAMAVPVAAGPADAEMPRVVAPGDEAEEPAPGIGDAVSWTAAPDDEFEVGEIAAEPLIEAAEAETSAPLMTMPDFEDELSAELDIYRHELEITANDEQQSGAIPTMDADDDAGDFDAAAGGYGDVRVEDDGLALPDIDFDAELGSALAGAFDDDAAPEPAAGWRAEPARDWQAEPVRAVFTEPIVAVHSTATQDPGDELAVAFSDLLPADRAHAAQDPAWPDDFDLSADLAALDDVARHPVADQIEPHRAEDVSPAWQPEPEAGTYDEPALDDADWLDAMDRSEPTRPAGVAPAAAVAAAAAGMTVAAFPAQAARRVSVPRDMGADAFDLAAIAETSNGPDTVRDLDIPSVPHAAEPGLVAGTVFEDEIEREFADLVEQETRDLHVPTPSEWPARVGEEVHPAAAEPPVLEDALETQPLQAEATEVAYRPRPVPVDADQALRAAEVRSRGEGRGRGPVIAFAVLGAAVLFGGVALGWSYFSGGGEAPDGGPRIIRADREPVKVAPENPGGLTVPNQDKAVYDRVAGADATAPASQPTLVTSAEEPVDVVQRTLDPTLLPLEGRDDTDPTKGEERLTESAAEAASGEGAAAPAEPIVSPRKVRTMIVRPDGTIVAREEPVTEPATPAAPAQEIAAAPAAPETAAAPAGALRPTIEQPDAATAQTLAAAPDTPAPQAPAAEVPAAEAPAATPEAPAEDAPLAPVRVVKTTPITPNAANTPVPTARPADQPVNVVGTVTETGRVTEGAPAAPVANAGGYFIQIASQPTPEGAQSSYQTLSNRYANIIGGRGVDIQRADIPGKGVFHRVRIPAGDRAAANALCAQYKAAGGSCLVTR